MGCPGDVGIALHFVTPVTAVAKFPMVADHFGHNAGAADKRHHDNTHFLQIDFRAVIEFLLSFDGQLLGGFGQIDDFGTRILNTSKIGIGLQ